VAPTALAADQWYVSTRRGKQFNSMVLASTDPLTGARRDAVYIDEHDAGVIGVADGDPLVLVGAAGRFAGRAKLVRLPARTLQVHWPEGNVLLSGGAEHREPASRVPDYNTVVTLEVGT
jgi:anaerobic selenocysteine-containing dehydrogenase